MLPRPSSNMPGIPKLTAGVLTVRTSCHSVGLGARLAGVDAEPPQDTRHAGRKTPRNDARRFFINEFITAESQRLSMSRRRRSSRGAGARLHIGASGFLALAGRAE